jgi:hypothetical protein
MPYMGRCSKGEGRMGLSLGLVENLNHEKGVKALKWMETST